MDSQNTPPTDPYHQPPRPSMGQQQPPAGGGQPGQPGYRPAGPRPQPRPPAAAGHSVKVIFSTLIDAIAGLSKTAWKVIFAIIAIGFLIHFFRFTPLVNNGMLVVWDRIDHRFCGISAESRGALVCE